MGLFSSSYETTVGTSVSRVIEDRLLPNSLKSGSTKYLFGKSDLFIENVMEDLINGIGVRANNAHFYGQNHYQYGLPHSTTHSSLSGKSASQAAIEAEVGGPVIMDYYHFGALNLLHAGWYKLTTAYGFNRTTSILGNLSTAHGHTVYLANLTVCITPATLAKLTATGLEQWGDPASTGLYASLDPNADMAPVLKHTPFTVDSGATEDYVKADYYWRTNSFGPATYGTFNIPITGFDRTKEFHQASYYWNGSLHYWIYEAGSGGHTGLDNLFNPDYQADGSYFPWLYFRYEKTSGAADLTSESYKQSKRLARYFGMDYKAMVDAIHENPDIDKIEQAIMMMAVPANTNDPTEQLYLFDYFNLLYERTGGALLPAEEKVMIGNTIDYQDPNKDGSIIIQDNRFKMGLGFHRIFKKTVVGNIGKVGSCNMTTGFDSRTYTTVDQELGNEYHHIAKTSYHIYRKQVSDILVEEVKVTGLRMVYHIYGAYTTIGNSDNDYLLIPVDRSITKDYSIPVQELLYARSLHYIFNSRIVTELAWYEQEWFRVVIIVIAVIITVLSLGQTIKELLTAIALTASIQTIVYLLLSSVLEYLLTATLIKLFVTAIGAEAAFVIAIIAACVGVYDAAQAGSLNGAPWAKDLLTLSSGISSGITKDMQNKFSRLEDESLAFQTDVDMKEKKLEEAQKLLEHDNRLLPIIIFGESPKDFYHRTVHSGNIGVLGLDAISMYVDGALTLPKLTDTL